MKQVRNDLVVLTYYDDDNNKPYIIGKDLTDGNNEPTFYTRNVRGLEKCWNELTRVFTDNTKMNDAEHLCDEYKLNTHFYCAVD